VGVATDAADMSDGTTRRSIVQYSSFVGVDTVGMTSSLSIFLRETKLEI
jgi:hypothetical protein